MPDEKLARAIRASKRREILKLLCEKNKVSVHEIADKLKITESSASRHLKLLFDLGFLEFEDKAPEKFYFLRIRELKDFFKIYDEIVSLMTV